MTEQSKRPLPAPWPMVLAVCMWAATIAAFFSAGSFILARVPMVINAAGPQMVPEDWPAAVPFAGDYYRWWTIGQNPMLFAASVVIFLRGVAFTVRHISHIRSDRRSDPH